MKKRYAFFMCMLMAAMLTFSGCQPGKEKKEGSKQNKQKESMETDGGEEKNDEGINLAGLCREGDYALRATALLAESRLLLCYERENDYRFKIYDLVNRKIESESEILSTDGGLSGGIEVLRVLPEYFYVFSGTDCYIYDTSCNLVRQMDISDKITLTGYTVTIPYWIADDLSHAAYLVKKEGGAECLYVSNLDGSGEELVYEMGDLEVDSQDRAVTDALWVDRVYWSAGKDCLGFSGRVIPEGRNLSVDCYGYITLADKKAEIFPEDNTWTANRGNIMLIADNHGEYGSVKKGKIRLLDLETKEKREVTMKFPDECTRAGLGTDPEYFVGMHEEEKTYSYTFTVYKDGEAFASAEYTCKDEQEYMDTSSSANFLALDTDTGQIFLFYNDTPSVAYAVKAFSYKPL